MSDAGGLLARLGSPERGVQRAACDEALARIERDPGVSESLIRLLREGTRLARFAAAFVLYRGGPGRGLRLLPALLDSLELDDGDLRWEAAHMLAHLGRRHPEVFPVLLQAATTASPRTRRMALYTLRELAPERAETEARLLGALDDADPDVRAAALSSLAKLTEPGPRALERVLALLERGAEPRLRRIAAVVLPQLATRLGSADRARAALERLAVAHDRGLERAVASALARLSPETSKRRE